MQHTTNTPIYFSGDRANECGYGNIIDIYNGLYKVKMDNTNQLFYITDKDLSIPVNKPYKRFYTKSEYLQDKQNKINKFNNLINNNK